ncbi:MAG: hypothetical protein JSW00_19465 [Thermoplasmata archaeon]|nr:MAG: hypothetical protein JSW00_19465 [Thermoplasmata archaeon]
MVPKNHAQDNKIIIIALLIAIATSAIILVYSIKTGPTSSPFPIKEDKEDPGLLPCGGDEAVIMLEKVEFNDTTKIRYIDIGKSDLENYTLLANALDAYNNTDKYQDAFMYENTTLFFNTTGYYAEPLMDYLHGRFFKKYLEYIDSPYIIKYNKIYYSLSMGIA